MANFCFAPHYSFSYFSASFAWGGRYFLCDIFWGGWVGGGPFNVLVLLSFRWALFGLIFCVLEGFGEERFDLTK